MIQLSQEEFRRLASIVQSLPDFSNVRDRRRLVAGALEGVPRAETVLARLDLDGAPMAVAVEVLRFLAHFGQVAYGKEGLGVFLNYILPFAEDTDAIFITGLFETYPLDASVSDIQTLDRWRSADNIADVQEKIIGENTLRHLYMLELALEAAKAVVHIRVNYADGKEALGTGFLVAANLLITNHHVIRSASEAETATCSFNYQLDRNGQLCRPSAVYASPDGMFHTSAELDYTVIQLEDPPDVGFLKMGQRPVHRDDRVTIIQHPGGHLKQISMQNNFVAYADMRTVQYTTSTLPGSSGSPVLNDAMDVVAIHHSGGMLTEPSTGRRYLRNAGTSMIAVLGDLKTHAREIYVTIDG